jgi:hypothetical protein
MPTGAEGAGPRRRGHRRRAEARVPARAGGVALVRVEAAAAVALVRGDSALIRPAV